MRLYQAALSRIRGQFFRALGADIRGPVNIRAIEFPRNWSDVVIESGVSLDSGVVCLCSGPPRHGKLSIGTGTYVNRYTMFDAHSHLEVGRDCIIGPYCYLTDADHGITLGQLARRQPMVLAAVIIEDGVWIGAHSVILRGVRVGAGSVIGAGSVVTSDIPANTVAAGVPARPLRKRA